MPQTEIDTMQLIAAERDRQITCHGYTPSYDASHEYGLRKFADLLMRCALSSDPLHVAEEEVYQHKESHHTTPWHVCESVPWWVKKAVFICEDHTSTEIAIKAAAVVCALADVVKHQQQES